MRTLTFKTRLWLGHVAVLAAMLALAAFGADWALRRVVMGRVIDDAILWLASTEAAALQVDPAQPVRVHEMPPGAGPPSFTRLDKFVQITDLDGRVVARGATLGTARLPTPPALLARVRDGETVFATVTDFGEEPVRMVSLPVSVGPARYAVQVAMSLDDADAVLRAGRWLFLSMSLAILAGIGLTSALLARQALRPIDRVVTRARRIGEANLADRLPHPGTHDEIGRLVETLNDMLRRLERSFEVQRQFTADASHELRSPLSRLRAELEVALRRPRAASDYEETLRSCLDEVERVQGLTEELLELARIDARQEPEPAEPISVGDIVDAAVAAIRPKAEHRGVVLVVEPSPDLLVTCGADRDPGRAREHPRQCREVLADGRPGERRRHRGARRGGHHCLRCRPRCRASGGAEALPALLSRPRLPRHRRPRRRPRPGDRAGARRAPGRAHLRGGDHHEGRDVQRAPAAHLTLAEEEFTSPSGNLQPRPATLRLIASHLDAEVRRTVISCGALTMSGPRAVIVLGLCSALAACAPRARLKEPSPDGPAISDLEFVPGRTIEGCPAVLRFHFDSRAEDTASGATVWTLMQGRADGKDATDSKLPAASGSLGGKTAGDVAIPFTFPDQGEYRYHVQVQDEAGRWSNARDAGIVVDRRPRHAPLSCP